MRSRSASLALALAVHALAPLAAGAVFFSAAPREAHAFAWPNVPDRIKRALKSQDAVERRRAAGRLLELPKATAIELAKSALADEDLDVRLRVSEALIALRAPRAGDLVLEWLSDPDPRLRRAACDVVKSSPTDRSVLALGRVLADPDSTVRLAAAAALGGSGSPEAVSPLLGHLEDPTIEVRTEVARALGRLGDPRAALPLIGKVQDGSSEVRRAAARALGDLGDVRAVSALMLALQDSAQEVRIEALASLGRLGSDEATLAIAPLLDADQDGPAPVLTRSRVAVRASGPGPAEVQAAALRALGAIGSDSAVRTLLAALGKNDALVSRSPVRAAIVAAGKGAVPALVAHLSGAPSTSSASGAALALAEIGGKEAEAAIVRAMQRGVVPLTFGLRALGRLGERSALPTVLEHLDDPDAAARREAVAAALQLLDPADPDGRAVDPAKLVLSDVRTPLDERIALVKLLGQTGSPRAEASILPLADRKPKALRVAALEALGALGKISAKSEAVLFKALDDDASEVRFQAAASLARAASGGAADKLLVRLSRAAEQDRGAVGIALSGALSRSTDEAVATRVAAMLPRMPENARDAIFEGLGRMKAAAATRALGELARKTGTSVDDRRKIAEALGNHPDGGSALAALVVDADPTVRAAAAWSLGAAGGAGRVPLLAARLKDADVTVAGNAAASLGRLAARLPAAAAPVKTALCGSLEDHRPYVRANAVAGLTVAGQACEPRTIRDLLAHDLAEAVRLAAADHLAKRVASAPAKPASAPASKAGPTPAPTAKAAAPASTDAAATPARAAFELELDRRALRRCVVDDRNATVAAKCGAVVGGATAARDDVLVFVVPDAGASPAARAPFALVLPNGTMRLGVADRRGAVFERAAPRGTLRLAVPAALAR